MGVTPEEASRQMFKKPGFGKARPSVLGKVGKFARPLAKTGLGVTALALGFDRIEREKEKTRGRVAGPFAGAYGEADIEPLTISEALSGEHFDELPERLQVSEDFAGMPPEWQVAGTRALGERGAADVEELYPSGRALRVGPPRGRPEEAGAPGDTTLQAIINERNSRIEAMVAGLGPGSDELKRELRTLDDERQNALAQLEASKPEYVPRHEREKKLAWLQGAAMGAAGIGNEYEVGRILAAAGGGGLGGLAQFETVSREEEAAFNEQMMRFETARTSLLVGVADSRAADLIRIHTIEADLAKTELNAKLEAAKSLSIRLDTQNGKYIILDPITGGMVVGDTIPYDQLMARALMRKGLGGSKAQIINDLSKNFEIDPAIQPYQAAALEALNGAHPELKAIGEENLKASMTEEEWEFMMKEIRMGSEDQARLFRERLYEEMMKFLMESGDAGRTVVRDINEVMFREAATDPYMLMGDVSGRSRATLR